MKQLGAKRYESLSRRAQSTQKYGQYEKDALLPILRAQREAKEHLKKNWTVSFP